MRHKDTDNTQVEQSKDITCSKYVAGKFNTTKNQVINTLS